jgi:hypothetical protein
MSRKRLLSGIALAVVLAACGDSGGDPLGPTGGPSMDGGLVVGGNKSDTTSTGTQAPTDDGGLVVGGN